ncbi:MAG: hypothetical protein ACOCXJ_04180 [Planctomycetota bacterium]
MATTTVYGSVIDANTLQLISSAVVSCPGVTVQNSNGSYTADVTQEGDHDFTASASGYHNSTTTITCSGGYVEHTFKLTPV